MSTPVITGNIGGRIGNAVGQKLTRILAQKQAVDDLECNTDFTPLNEVYYLPMWLTLFLAFLLMFSLTSVGIISVILGTMGVLGISNPGHTELSRLADNLTGIFLGLVLILIFGPMLNEVLSMLITRVYFNNQGIIIKRLFSSKRFTWAQLEDVRITFLSRNILFLFENGHKIYLSFAVQANLYRMIVCAYRGSIKQSIKDKLERLSRLYVGRKIPK